MAAVLLPWLYIQARCRHDLERLDALVAQSRVGEAAALARGLAGLAPRTTFRDLPMTTVAAEMAALEGELRQRTNSPLPPGASDEDCLARARDLAQLGQRDGALAMLNSTAALATSHAGNYLRGLVYLDRDEFDAALAAFQSARQSLAALPPSEDARLQKIDLLRQIAYCQRKLGRYAEADAAYRELLAADASADTHFLLAQFYQDAEQATVAQFHARRAMTLDAARYAAPGQRLIDNLITNRFGCWGVFASERASTPASH
jgi:tetratricopeptide (TPR) repeat protein